MISIGGMAHFYMHTAAYSHFESIMTELFCSLHFINRLHNKLSATNMDVGSATSHTRHIKIKIKSQDVVFHLLWSECVELEGREREREAEATRWKANQLRKHKSIILIMVHEYAHLILSFNLMCNLRATNQSFCIHTSERCKYGACSNRTVNHMTASETVSAVRFQPRDMIWYKIAVNYVLIKRFHNLIFYYIRTK